MKNVYISQLPIVTQIQIKDELISLGLDKDAVERGLSSRLYDLEDTIDIKPYLKNFDINKNNTSMKVSMSNKN